jgi:hypothetical protein
VARNYPSPFFIFQFTYLFSIKFLYFFIISSVFPYFNLFVSIFIQSYVNSNLHVSTLYLCMKTVILILYKKNDVAMRHDCKVDNRGKQLLDLCIGSKLRFLNGRMWGDSYGKFTCIKPSGSSVVDYVIMTHVRKFTRKHIIFSSFRFYPHFIRLSL